MSVSVSAYSFCFCTNSVKPKPVKRWESCSIEAILPFCHFAIGRWADTYRAKGLRGLLHLNYRGGDLAPSIPVEIQWQLKDQLAQSAGFSSYKAIQIWLKETHGLDVPLSTVHGTVKYRFKAGPKVP